MQSDYIWAVATSWQRRHVATIAAGTTGLSRCGRPVMSYERATDFWAANNPHLPAPELDELTACEVCVKLTGVIVSGPRGQRVAPSLAAYARRVDEAEQVVRKDNGLLREVMELFSPGHDLTGRSRDHADCQECKLLRRIRYRLIRDDRVATRT